MNKAKSLLLAGMSLMLIAGVGAVWHTADEPVTPVTPVAKDDPRQLPAAPLNTDAAPLVSEPSANIVIAAAEPVAISPRDENYQLYIALFSADPGQRRAVLDVIAQKPEQFQDQESLSQRLAEMSLDDDNELAEQAARVLSHLLAWQISQQDGRLPTVEAWEAARTIPPVQNDGDEAKVGYEEAGATVIAFPPQMAMLTGETTAPRTAMAADGEEPSVFSTSMSPPVPPAAAP